MECFVFTSNELLLARTDGTREVRLPTQVYCVHDNRASATCGSSGRLTLPRRTVVAANNPFGYSPSVRRQWQRSSKPLGSVLRGPICLCVVPRALPPLSLFNSSSHQVHNRAPCAAEKKTPKTRRRRRHSRERASALDPCLTLPSVRFGGCCRP